LENAEKKTGHLDNKIHTAMALWELEELSEAKNEHG
jgi:hypothetical protein